MAAMRWSRPRIASPTASPASRSRSNARGPSRRPSTVLRAVSSTLSISRASRPTIAVTSRSDLARRSAPCSPVSTRPRWDFDLPEPAGKTGHGGARARIHRSDATGEFGYRFADGADVAVIRLCRLITGRVSANPLFGRPIGDRLLDPFVQRHAGLACRFQRSIAGRLVDTPDAPRQARFHWSTPMSLSDIPPAGRPGAVQTRQGHRTGNRPDRRLTREFGQHGKQAVNSSSPMTDNVAVETARGHVDMVAAVRGGCALAGSAVNRAAAGPAPSHETETPPTCP